jgi:hypothetical protein
MIYLQPSFPWGAVIYLIVFSLVGGFFYWSMKEVQKRR